MSDKFKDGINNYPAKIIHFLYNNNNVNASYISKKLGSPYSWTTLVIRNLEKNNYLIIKTGINKRTKGIVLTEKGKKVGIILNQLFDEVLK